MTELPTDDLTAIQRMPVDELGLTLGKAYAAGDDAQVAVLEGEVMTRTAALQPSDESTDAQCLRALADRITEQAPQHLFPCWSELGPFDNCTRRAGHTGPCLATCGDCEEGRCHIPVEPPAPGVGDPGCGCARHSDSLLALQLDGEQP